eukprot:gene19998-26711_t
MQSEERDKALELLLEQTGKHAEPGEKITRIDLTRVQRLPSSTPSSSTPFNPALQTQPMQSEERDKALELLLERTGKHPEPGEKITRIDLTRVQRAYSILEKNGQKLLGLQESLSLSPAGSHTVTNGQEITAA